MKFIVVFFVVVLVIVNGNPTTADETDFGQLTRAAAELKEEVASVKEALAAQQNASTGKSSGYGTVFLAHAALGYGYGICPKVRGLVK